MFYRSHTGNDMTAVDMATTWGVQGRQDWRIGPVLPPPFKTYWDETGTVSQTTFLKIIFFNGFVWISIKISLTFVSDGTINNISALVQILDCRRPGDKPLSEPMMVNLPTHICVTRPQWVKSIDIWCHRVYISTHRNVSNRESGLHILQNWSVHPILFNHLFRQVTFAICIYVFTLNKGKKLYVCV